mgnify:CR=1 FL=1
MTRKRKPKLMKQIFAGMGGDGAHCGLTDRYSSQEAALVAALAAHEPFDTGWYSSKKEIATARIYSEDGVEIKVEVSVSDDFDTSGYGYVTVTDWTVSAVDEGILEAWQEADEDQEGNACYAGFSVLHGRQCVDYYLVSSGEHLAPPGDSYRWWGWQFACESEDDEIETGIADPAIPLPIVAAFENWAQSNAWGEPDAILTIGEWSIKPWSKR